MLQNYKVLLASRCTQSIIAAIQIHSMASSRILLISVAAVFCCFHVAHARSLLSLFVPQGSDACSTYVQSSCTLVQSAQQRTDTCSQSNAAQLASAVAGTDKSQVSRKCNGSRSFVFECYARGLDRAALIANKQTDGALDLSRWFAGG